MKFFCGFFFCLFLCLPSSRAFGAVNEDFADTLRSVLKNNPEIILDILRNHSESVLDIAQQGSNMRRKKNMENQWREDLKQPKQAAIAGRPVLGPPDAPVSVIAFSDFTCPYCRQAADVLERLMQARAGEIRLIFKHMPHGKDSPARVGAEYFVAASLQNPQAAWILYKKFFEEAEKLTAEGAVFAARAAEAAGLDMKKLHADLKSKKIRSVIDEDLADAKRLGVEGTPYFLINNLVVRGALSYDLFNAAVQTALDAGKK